MPFTSVTGRKARARLQGLHRAAYWKKLGYINCTLARAAQARYREERKQAALALQQQADDDRRKAELQGSIDALRRK
jgi:hypothetical protein